MLAAITCIDINTLLCMVINTSERVLERGFLQFLDAHSERGTCVMIPKCQSSFLLLKISCFVDC